MGEVPALARADLAGSVGLWRRYGAEPGERARADAFLIGRERFL